MFQAVERFEEEKERREYQAKLEENAAVSDAFFLNNDYIRINIETLKLNVSH